MLPIISYNGTCRFPVREQAFLLMETTVPFKGTGISSEETNASEETYRNIAGIAVRSTASGKSNDGCYSKGVGRCQFADGIYSYFVLRIVFKHYFHHSILLGSCI